MTRPIVVTGGGTGGHIFPMQAIAESLRAQGVEPGNLRYVGSRRGQEGVLLGGGVIPLTLLSGRGIRRSMQPAALVANVGAVVGLLVGVLRAIALVGVWRPRAVVSVGGYASFPVSLAAVLWRRPLILVDLDATPPATHRLLARFAVRRCVAYGNATATTVVTGAPVRADIAAIDRSTTARTAARDAVGATGRRVIVVMTGSLGAASVNRAVVALAQLWASRDDLTLVHVTGRRDEAWVRASMPDLQGLDYRVESFADMSQWWRCADLAVCRAGATTVAELTTVGVPAVLVPLPHAPGDHQGANARALVAAGAAVLVPDDQVSGAALADALTPLLDDQVLARMSAASRALARPDAADQIARVVLEVAR